MLGTPNRDRRAERRSATRAEILEAAWGLCAAGGLSSLSMRDLAQQIGLKAPSMYSYFESKNAIYDAMFAQGCRQFLEGRPMHVPADLLDGIKVILSYFVSFCVADPVRHQLLFQRTIPGFEPSAESYAISQTAMQLTRDWFNDHGLNRPEVIDLFTALGSGLAAQQNSNEPGGDRWTRLVDDAALMFVRHIQAVDIQPARPGRKRT
ncbi:TetR/AcrR family transcriptional regulator [Nakamurella sp. GG22]